MTCSQHSIKILCTWMRCRVIYGQNTMVVKTQLKWMKHFYSSFINDGSITPCMVFSSKWNPSTVCNWKTIDIEYIHFHCYATMYFILSIFVQICDISMNVFFLLFLFNFFSQIQKNMERMNDSKNTLLFRLLAQIELF